jgi:hypothetical protein
LACSILLTSKLTNSLAYIVDKSYLFSFFIFYFSKPGLFYTQAHYLLASWVQLLV